MEWLYENPVPELLVCGVLAAVSTIVALQKQRGVLLLGTAFFLVLGVVAWFIDRGTQTDREAIELVLHDLVADFQRNDREGALEHISPQAFGTLAMVELGIVYVDLEEDYRITDVSIELSNQNSIARSHFRVNGTVSISGHGNQGPKPSRWEAHWQKTGEGWLMTNVVELDVISGQPSDRVLRWMGSMIPRR